MFETKTAWLIFSRLHIETECGFFQDCFKPGLLNKKIEDYQEKS